jgi:hypothetical protein
LIAIVTIRIPYATKNGHDTAAPIRLASSITAKQNNQQYPSNYSLQISGKIVFDVRKIVRRK